MVWSYDQSRKHKKDWTVGIGQSLIKEGNQYSGFFTTKWVRNPLSAMNNFYNEGISKFNSFFTSYLISKY